MSTKLFTILAVAIFGATLSFASAAEAGCGGMHKSNFGASHNYAAKKRARARAAARARARIAAKKRAKARAIARARARARAKMIAANKAKAAKIAAAAKTEGTFVEATSTAALLTKSDITTDTIEKKPATPAAEMASVEAEKTEDKVITASEGTSCKRFVPAVGMTITVACE